MSSAVMTSSLARHLAGLREFREPGNIFSSAEICGDDEK